MSLVFQNIDVSGSSIPIFFLIVLSVQWSRKVFQCSISFFDENISYILFDRIPPICRGKTDEPTNHILSGCYIGGTKVRVLKRSAKTWHI